MKLPILFLEKIGLCHRICHFIDSFRRAKADKFVYILGQLASLYLACMGKACPFYFYENFMWKGGSDIRQGCVSAPSVVHLLLGRCLRCFAHPLSYYLLMRKKLLGAFRLTFHCLCVVCCPKALCTFTLWNTRFHGTGTQLCSEQVVDCRRGRPGRIGLSLRQMLKHWGKQFY